MEGAIFGCPARWEAWLPPQVRRLRSAREAGRRPWDVLALTASGWTRLQGRGASCGVLLLPGGCCPNDQVRADRAVSWGLSPRDSLTLSSIREPVLCVQRFLCAPDGTMVEPQEIPLPDLPDLPALAEGLLPLLGLRLLFALPAVPAAPDRRGGRNRVTAALLRLGRRFTPPQLPTL